MYGQPRPTVSPHGVYGTRYFTIGGTTMPSFGPPVAPFAPFGYVSPHRTWISPGYRSPHHPPEASRARARALQFGDPPHPTDGTVNAAVAAEAAVGAEASPPKRESGVDPNRGVAYHHNPSTGDDPGRATGRPHTARPPTDSAPPPCPSRRLRRHHTGHPKPPPAHSRAPRRATVHRSVVEP